MQLYGKLHFCEEGSDTAVFMLNVFIKENDIAVLNQNDNVKGIDMAVWDTKMANDIAT